MTDTFWDPLVGPKNLPLTAGDLGLDQVDNTADADKPVSGPQQAALNGKASLASVNASFAAAKLNPTTPQRFSPTASGTTITLPFTVGPTETLELHLNGVRQWPTLDFTLSGTTVTFLGAGVTTDDVITVRKLSLSFT